MIKIFLLSLQFFTPITPYYSYLNTDGGWLTMTLQTEDSACTACGDFNIVYEDPEATIGFDDLYDGYNLPSQEPTPTLFTMLPGDDFISLSNFNGLSVQCFPSFEIDSIKLGAVSYKDSAMFTFYIGGGFTSGTLHDKLLNTFTSIDSGTTYSFIVDSLGWNEKVDDRFILHFHRDTLLVLDLEQDGIEVINTIDINYPVRYYNLSGEQIDKPRGICIQVVGIREPELIIVRE
tara:strand:+ start:3259 stop:3957 length:699 start_codon:yes stop_codon:yes gene_type:complete